MRKPLRRDRRGFALLLTLLLALLVAGMAVGVFLMMSNTNIVAKFHASEASMTNAAEAGLEWARDTLNGTPGLIPQLTGFSTLQQNAAVQDAYGNVIPGFTRSVYAGPTGNTTGQFGVFASVISVISSQRGAVVVRRAELKQDSFARFARFFNTWSCCSWGATEVVFGPVHSNQGMALQSGSPGATFWGPVTTVGSITNQSTGHWNGGVTTGVSPITFPTTQTLTNLQTFASAGNMMVGGDARLNAVDPEVRIDFVAIDLDNDGDVSDDNEGFFRVYHIEGGASGTLLQERRNVATARRFTYNVTLTYPSGATAGSDPNLFSPNCGGNTSITGTSQWLTADSIMNLSGFTTSQKLVAAQAALAGPGRRCYLGGDSRLWATSGTPGSPRWVVGDGWGYFLPWSGWGGSPPSELVAAVRQGAGVSPDAPTNGDAAAVASTFWPLSRSYNANFHGVIFVTGSVAVSGQVRGRVTLVAQGDVMLPDDITYVQAPNTNCADILGILTTGDAFVEDNSLNTPFRVQNIWTVRFDDTPNETFQSFFLTLGNFGGENLFGDPSPVSPENCGGKSRGCKSIVGGTIQQGVSGTFNGSTGWAEQDTYDNCGVKDPPPYFPTTGRFAKYKYYEIDPVGFNVAAWFAANQ